ncbi:hypothetical protein OH76DRAFT_1347408, partial [Lentinus brumalis]
MLTNSFGRYICRAARVSTTHGGRPSFEWCAQTELTLNTTHTFDNVYTITSHVSLDALPVVYDDVLVNASLVTLLSLYSRWQTHDLTKLANVHRVRVIVRDTAATLFDKLVEHECTPVCPHTIVSFTTLRVIRSDRRSFRPRAPPLNACPVSAESYLPIVDDALRRFIITDWQRTLTTANLRLVPCATCARRTAANDIINVHPDEFDLSLLRNDALPPAVYPSTYAFHVYGNALLYPKGMLNRWQLAPLLMCSKCHKDLVINGSMPKLCLANWLYYGLDELPADVSASLAASTPVDKLLIARARTSRISFRFKESSSRETPGDEPDPSGPADSVRVPQRYVRGNVLVMPQNSTQFNDVLPPSPSVIKDTVCAVFVGRTMPTMQTIGKFRTLLARKSVVATLIRFLVSNNAYYAADSKEFFGFSRVNLDALFGPGTSSVDTGIPAAMEIGFLEDNEAIAASTAEYTSRNNDDDAPSNNTDMLIENVGYTCGDDSPVSYRDMKMRALSHCLHGGRFLCSKAGDKFVPDFENPALLTWLFPHLDPWGIGGFHHPDRSVKITMEDQLKYLLELDDGRFECDPDFGFVYYNILQKKMVCDSVRFRVKASQQHRVVADLLSVDKELLQRMLVHSEHNPAYKPTTSEEVQLVSLIDNVSAVLPNIPGTTGYKLTMRNEIRALVNFRGTPAFFITLNPSDIHHPLVRLFAGEDINLEDASVGEELTSWQRKLLVAKSPGACARFFHTMISHFISIILRYGKTEKGLFG